MPVEPVIPPDMFDQLLKEVVRDNIDRVLDIQLVYDILADQFKNDVAIRWKEQRWSRRSTAGEYGRRMIYVIVSQFPVLRVWDGEAWTTDLQKAARYRPNEFPDEIESALGLYTLTIGTQLNGVPSRYEPPDEYWDDYKKAFPENPNEYREPPEWLVDEYDDPLYVVVPIDELDQQHAR